MSFLVLETGSLTGLARPTGQRAPRTLLFLVPKCSGYKYMLLCLGLMSSGDTNPGPYPYIPIALPPVLSS